jgi:hypothetical protein
MPLIPGVPILPLLLIDEGMVLIPGGMPLIPD